MNGFYAPFYKFNKRNDLTFKVSNTIETLKSVLSKIEELKVVDSDTVFTEYYKYDGTFSEYISNNNYIIVKTQTNETDK